MAFTAEKHYNELIKIKPERVVALRTHSETYHSLVVSTPEYLNRFRSGITLIFMIWTVKNNLDADPFNLDRIVVRKVVSNRV